LLQLNAQKRSGKTRLLKLLSNLACKSDGSVSTSPTETLLFRHKEGALFFDEMDNINSKERSAFRETLNAVYKKGNKIVRYKEKKVDGVKEYVEDNFFPYYPLGLANIKGMNDVLEDRSIQIILRRSNKKLTKLVEDYKTNKDILELKEQLKKLKTIIPNDFFGDWNNYIEGKEVERVESVELKELVELYNKINKAEIFGRSLEIFFPLIIISNACGIIDNFLETTKDYIKFKEEEEAIDDIDERLKNFLLQNFNESVGFVSVASILSGFRNHLEAPEEWVNSKWLGRALKRLDLIKQKRLINGRTQIIIKHNSTNSTHSIYYTNSTNSTNSKDSQRELVKVK